MIKPYSAVHNPIKFIKNSENSRIRKKTDTWKQAYMDPKQGTENPQLSMPRVPAHSFNSDFHEDLSTLVANRAFFRRS